MKQFDHMIERKLNLELSNVFPRLKFLTGCGQFSDFSNKHEKHLRGKRLAIIIQLTPHALGLFSDRLHQVLRLLTCYYLLSLDYLSLHNHNGPFPL